MDDIQFDLIYYFCLAVPCIACVQDAHRAIVGGDRISWTEFGWCAATCYVLPAAAMLAIAAGSTRGSGELVVLPDWARTALAFWMDRLDDGIFGAMVIGFLLAFVLPGALGGLAALIGGLCFLIYAFGPVVILLAATPFATAGDFAVDWHFDASGREAGAALWIVVVGAVATALRSIRRSMSS